MATLSEYLEIEQVCSQLVRGGHSSVAICAANCNEGVSTVAKAMAEHCRQANKKTLLVDMNYCRPSMDKHFSLQRDEWTLGASMEASITQTDSGLFVLPASLTMDSQLRQASVIRHQLQQWRNDFDAIVLDVSPLNAINRHNLAAEQVCAVADATVMVVRSALTKEADILEALAKLKSHEANVAGWVMNDLNCPSLASEIYRELERLGRYAPRITRWLKRKIQENDFVNQVM